MRGDSLRDLYAKTLAILGLGLLAGAGAVVDYWPVGGTLPLVDRAELPVPVRPELVQRFDQEIPAPAIKPALVVRGTIHPKNVGRARFLTPVLDVTPPPAPAVPAAPTPPPFESSPVPVPPQLSVVTAEPILPVTVSSVTEDSSRLIDAPIVAPAASPGLIGGALRKTKDSIVRTGAVAGATVVVTGNTIADAFKGVVGAFKKVSPF